MSVIIRSERKNFFVFRNYSQEYVERLAAQFKQAKPFPHLVFEDFLNLTPDELACVYPAPDWPHWNKRHDFYQSGKMYCRDTDVIPHLWRQGRRLQDGYNALAAEAGLTALTRCIGLPPRTVLTFADRRGVESLALKSLFQQEVVRRGILNTGGFNLCARHSDADVDRTLEACRAALGVLAAAVAADDVEARLQGPAIQPVFRRA